MPSSKRLFVGSLPYKYSEGELLSLFISEGKVISVKIIKNRWGKSRGMAYVEYENESDAVKAKNKYHNYQINDRTIIVDFAKPDPFLTPEGKAKHEEAVLKRQKNKKRFNLDDKENSSNYFSKSKDSFKKTNRQSVYDSRHHGAKVGAKFASRSKNKKK